MKSILATLAIVVLSGSVAAAPRVRVTQTNGQKHEATLVSMKEGVLTLIVGKQQTTLALTKVSRIDFLRSAPETPKVSPASDLLARLLKAKPVDALGIARRARREEKWETRRDVSSLLLKELADKNLSSETRRKRRIALMCIGAIAPGGRRAAKRGLEKLERDYLNDGEIQELGRRIREMWEDRRGRGAGRGRSNRTAEGEPKP